MKPPYKAEPTPVYEVPFDNPDLVAKANKNGTIIVNKDRVHDKKLMDEAMSHEKQHLKDMQDGKLDYDNLSVTFKGKRYDRDSFDEGNQNLPWEKRAYAAGRKRKKIDLTPKKKKLTGPPAMSDGKPLLVDNISSPFQALDENEVNMNENFGPALELDEVAKQLDKAVVAHGIQADAIRKHQEEMKDMEKGTSLHSPIKMWGAPALHQKDDLIGKNTDPSGEDEAVNEAEKENKPLPSGSLKIMYDSGTNQLGFTTGYDTVTGLTGDNLSALYDDDSLYNRNKQKTFDDQGNLTKVESKPMFRQRFSREAKALMKARDIYNRPDAGGRNILREMYANPKMSVGDFFIVPSGGYDDSKSYLENLQQAQFAQRVYKDDEQIGDELKNWEDLSPSEKKRYFKGEREIRNKDFYDTEAYKKFKKLFPSTNLQG